MDIVRKNSPRFWLKSIDYTSSDSHEILYCGLRDTIKVLQKNGVKNIYLVAQLPQASAVVPLSANKLTGLFKFTEEEVNAILGESAEVYAERTQKITEILHKLTQEFSHVYLLEPAPYFLNTQKTGYEVVRGKTALYHDDDHLSAEGAALLKPLFEPIFADLAKK